MTPPDRDYDDILSRALRSTLDPIEPAGDGLAKIQRRIAEPWLKRQLSLIRMELSALGWLVAVRSEPFRTRARSRLAGFAARSGDRLRSAPGALGAVASGASSGRRSYSAGHSARAGDTGLRRWVGPTMTWLRPALAVAGAVVIVVVGVFAMGRFQESIGNSAASIGTHGHHPGGGVGGPTPAGHGSRLPGSSPGQGRSPGQKPNSKHPGKTNHKGTPKSSASATPSATPTPTPTPTPTATPTPTPTVTPTVTPTPSPTGGPVFGANGRGVTPKPRPGAR